MNILDSIVEHKRVEVQIRKQKKPLSDLEGSPFYRRKANRIELSSTGRPGIIAEFKRRSPSRGAINPEADPVSVAGDYNRAGAAAVSILTDRDFFGGSFRDLRMVREAYPGLVILRKDFIIDPYQVHEASAYGADMLLLIAAILDWNQIKELAQEARMLGLDILMEVHTAEEMEKYCEEIRFVGVNNRDLKNFRVDTGKSLELINRMPPGVIPVSESGIGEPAEIIRLSEAGYRLFLIGEAFMREDNPGDACRSIIERLK